MNNSKRKTLRKLTNYKGGTLSSKGRIASKHFLNLRTIVGDDGLTKIKNHLKKGKQRNTLDLGLKDALFQEYGSDFKDPFFDKYFVDFYTKFNKSPYTVSLQRAEKKLESLKKEIPLLKGEKLKAAKKRIKIEKDQIIRNREQLLGINMARTAYDVADSSLQELQNIDNEHDSNFKAYDPFDPDFDDPDVPLVVQKQKEADVNALLAKLKTYQAERELKSDNLKVLNNEIDVRKKELNQVKSSLRTEKKDLAQSEAILKRLEQLINTPGISKAKLDKLEDNIKKTKAQIDNFEKNITDLNMEIGGYNGELARLEKDRDATSNDIDNLDDLIKNNPLSLTLDKGTPIVPVVLEDEDFEVDIDDDGQVDYSNIEEFRAYLEDRGLDDDEIERQINFIKKQKRVREYQNVINILNSNYNKKRAEYGMVKTPTQSYISAGSNNYPSEEGYHHKESKYGDDDNTEGYYYPNYDQPSEDSPDFYRKIRRPEVVKHFANLYNSKAYYNKIIGKGRVDNNEFFDYYYGGDLYDGIYNEEDVPPVDKKFDQITFKHDIEKLNEEIKNVIDNEDSEDSEKESSYFSSSPLYSLTRELYFALKAFTISKDNAKIVGSSMSSSSFYPSDLDIMEIVTSGSEQQTIQMFVNGIRHVTDKIMKSEELIYDHVKLGIDYRYPSNIGVLRKGKIIPDRSTMEEIDNLYSNNLINMDEYNYIKNCKNMNQEYYENIVKILDDHRKIRWSSSDINNGFKTLKGGLIINISEACLSKSVINIEGYAILEDDKLLDISNFFILNYIENGKEIGINTDDDIDENMLNELKKSIYHLYYSVIDYNPIKMIKRMFSLNKLTGGKDIEKIVRILKSELGTLYYILTYTKNMIDFITKNPEEKGKIQYQRIIVQYVTVMNQYVHGLSGLSENKRNVIFKILNTIINLSTDIVSYDTDRLKSINGYIEKIGIILDELLMKLIKNDPEIKQFMPPPSKYLPPKSEQEYHK